MDQLTLFFSTGHFAGLFSILMIVLLIFHVVFSYILVRQVGRMIRVVEAQVSPVIQTIALLHLAASLIVFIWTILTA